MADEHKLPAQIAARALAPAGQAGSLVTRGLEAIKNRQRSLASVGVEADPEKSFREGVEAYKRRDFAEAVKRYRRAADKGHALAPFNLALMYDKGQGVPQDDAAAVSWYRKGAAQGDARAQCNLGAKYTNGRGVPQDYAAAATWYRKAAEQGDALAQCNLADIYDKGRGVPQDHAEALKVASPRCRTGLLRRSIQPRDYVFWRPRFAAGLYGGD